MGSARVMAPPKSTMGMASEMAAASEYPLLPGHRKRRWRDSDDVDDASNGSEDSDDSSDSDVEHEGRESNSNGGSSARAADIVLNTFGIEALCEHSKKNL